MRLPQLSFCHAILLTFLFSLSTLMSMASDAPSQPADLIVTNARIYTVNPQQKRAEAIAVRGGKIVAAGNRKQVEARRGPATRGIDAGQRLLLPGRTDRHIHPLEGALSC